MRESNPTGRSLPRKRKQAGKDEAGAPPRENRNVPATRDFVANVDKSDAEVEEELEAEGPIREDPEPLKHKAS